MPTKMITNRNLKVFAVSFVSVLMMVFLQYIVVNLKAHSDQFCMKVWNFQLYGCPSSLVSPQTQDTISMEQVLPKLHVQRDGYKVQHPTRLITPAVAGADYDQAHSYVVINYDTGEVLAEKSSKQAVPMASTTKIMSAMIALDLASADELFTVSEDAPKTIPTRLALTPGEKFTVEELLNAALLTSANDCVQVLKENIDQKYGKGVFVEAMNRKAAMLGLSNTHFANPQGFDDPEHYASADDLAIISHYALTHYPLISQIVAKDHGVLTASKLHTESWLNNWNGLIGVYPGTFGIKIGNTDNAKNTTVVAAEREGHQVLVVTLGAPGVLERDLWTAQLLDLGFAKLANLKPVNITEQQLRTKYQSWKYFN